MTSPSPMEPVGAAVERLRGEGFTQDFQLEHDSVVDSASGQRHRPEEVEVVSTHRNEGDSNPEDQSIIFGLRAPDGTLGVLVSNFGPDTPHADALRRLGQDAAKGQ